MITDDNTAVRPFESAIGSSRVVGATREASRTLAAARRGSVVAGLARTFVSAPASALVDRLVALTTHSLLYRWLTAEPEPEVIVIDLRETYTVGPVLDRLDRGVHSLGRAWPSSAAAALWSRLRPLRSAVVRSRTARAVSALLEPPDRERGA